MVGDEQSWVWYGLADCGLKRVFRHHKERKSFMAADTLASTAKS